MDCAFRKLSAPLHQPVEFPNKYSASLRASSCTDCVGATIQGSAPTSWHSSRNSGILQGCLPSSSARWKSRSLPRQRRESRLVLLYCPVERCSTSAAHSRVEVSSVSTTSSRKAVRFDASPLSAPVLHRRGAENACTLNPASTGPVGAGPSSAEKLRVVVGPGGRQLEILLQIIGVAIDNPPDTRMNCSCSSQPLALKLSRYRPRRRTNENPSMESK